MCTELRDQGGTPLAHVTVALGWDPAARPRLLGRRTEIDLNVAALLFAADRLVDVVYHEQLSSTDGSVRLHGDSVTGAGTGDDEVVSVDLSRLPPHVGTVLFLVTSYTGRTFDRIANAYCRVIDTVGRTQLARYDLTRSGSHTGLVLGRVRREAGGWRFEGVGEALQARHPVEAVPQLADYLDRA
ncbi:TerD family protein [Nocardia barduliensis]|uniref:TerD family protein n=1 Tax=Nocardia barduliensis TaxID=2736643 RepID=UPI001573402E|nr:TerD family protein [Nocardia barduliensis]